MCRQSFRTFESNDFTIIILMPNLTLKKEIQGGDIAKSILTLDFFGFHQRSLQFIAIIQLSNQFSKSLNKHMKVVIRVRPLSLKQNNQIQSYEQLLQGRKKNCKQKLSPQIISFYSKYRNANPREIVKIEDNIISVYDQEYKNSEKKMKDFSFSEVYGQKQSNIEIFERSIKENVNGVIEGYNCTIFAYGITGSGKTFSVFGHPKIQKDRGICFLTYQYLLQKKQEIQKDGSIVDIRFSFLQIYNENVRDLLSDDPRQQVSFGEDTKGNMQLIDASSVQIKSLQQIKELISIGSAKRASAATTFNQISSRSHAILKMSIDITKQQQKTSSKLFIIDLAGSEKINNDNFLRKTQGININKSLLTLGNCINALAENNKKSGASHIPYRDSKLTRILKDSLGGNAKIIMIGCISTNPFTLEETVTTLNYAERAKGIKKDPTRNVVSTEQQCPRCHKNMNSSAKIQIPAFQRVEINPPTQQMVEIQTISNELLERLYNDIVDNARELQKLQRLQSIMHEPCEQFNVVYNANQNQKNILKNTLMNLFQHKATLSKNEEDEAKPVKKKIRLSHSSRRSSKERTSIQKQNAGHAEQSREKRVLKQDVILNGICSNTFIPEASRSSQPKLKFQGLQPELSQQNRGSTVSIRKKKSKVQIIKRPPSYAPKRSCSERMVTEYQCSQPNHFE